MLQEHGPAPSQKHYRSRRCSISRLLNSFLPHAVRKLDTPALNISPSDLYCLSSAETTYLFLRIFYPSIWGNASFNSVNALYAVVLILLKCETDAIPVSERPLLVLPLPCYEQNDAAFGFKCDSRALVLVPAVSHSAANCPRESWSFVIKEAERQKAETRSELDSVLFFGSTYYVLN